MSEVFPLRSYLSRLSLVWAGTSVPLVWEGPLSISAPGFVRGRRHLPVLPVLPVSVVSPVFTPFLMGRWALSFVGRVRWSVSEGDEGKKKISTCRVFKVKFYHFFLQNVGRLKGEPLPLMPMRMGVRAVPLLVPVFPLPFSIPFTTFFSRMRGMVAPWTMGGWTAAIPDKTRKPVLPDMSHLSVFK